MNRTVLLTALAVVVLTTSSFADDKQERILAAIEGCASSIVQIEFECKQFDGKGSRKFSTTGLVVSSEGLIMVTGVGQIDPPVGGRYQKPESYSIIFGKDIKAKASFLGKDQELNLALLKIKERDPDEEVKEDEKPPVIKPIVFAQTNAPSLAEELLILDRLSKSADYQPTYKLMRVTAVVKKPTGPPEYWVTGSLGGVTGCPVLRLDGSVLGFVGRTSVEPSAGRAVSYGGRTFYMGGSRRGSPRILCYSDFKEFLADPSKFLRRNCWIGIRGMQALTKDLAEQFEVKKGGILLGEILKQSPAEKAGLQSGDVLTNIDGDHLDITEDKDVAKFSKRIKRAAAGTTMVFLVLREKDGKYVEQKLKVVMEEEPTKEYEVEEWEDKTFGIRVKILTRDFLDRERLPLKTIGVRVTYIESAGWASLAGLRNDDIIRGVVMQKTKGMDAFKKRLKEVTQAKEAEVCFNVLRRGKSLFLCVRPQWDLEKKKTAK